MVELATRGAGVLHPRSVELAKQYGVPLLVLNSLNPPTSDNEGTSVTASGTATVTERGMEDFAIAGITAAKDKFFMTVELERPTLLGALWDRAAQANLSIVAPVFSEGRVQFFVDRDAHNEWKRQLDRLSIEGFVKKFNFHDDLVPLSVVGDRFSQDSTALYQVIETLARSHISVTMGSASALAITVAVGSNMRTTRFGRSSGIFQGREAIMSAAKNPAYVVIGDGWSALASVAFLGRASLRCHLDRWHRHPHVLRIALFGNRPWR